MFFPERITSIKPTDKVLEVGPGATPYYRSDVFLEKEYETEKELIAQSGHIGILQTDKKFVTYSGNIFPFADKEFDYVICSHVLEHVENADVFLREIQRVGKRGYLEFPTIYYDYLYNFPEHQLFLLYRDGVINWMTKKESGLLDYAIIQKFFLKTCQLGYFEIINSCKDYFFQGFEWADNIKSIKVDNLEKLTYTLNEINLPSKLNQAPEAEIIDYSKISIKKHFRYKMQRFFK